MAEVWNLIVQELAAPSESELSSSTETTDSSLEEDMILVTQRKRDNVRKISMYIDVVRLYSDVIFQNHFRMGRAVAYKLIELLTQSKFLPIQKHGREKISPEKAFLLTLWYFSNQETYRQISDRFDVTRSSVYRTIKRVLKFLLSLKNHYIKWPVDQHDIKIITKHFKNIQGIDNILGILDGSHIEISKPKHNQDAYINRKGYHSLLLQGIVDYKKKFIDVFCGEPGSMHDARLLRKSAIYNAITTGSINMGDNYLLGDTAYPNLLWLVTPFKDNGRLTEHEKQFNYRISATRVVVENAFGLLKGRFRRLKKLDTIDLKMCSEIIMVSCILHNICLQENDEIDVEIDDFHEPDDIESPIQFPETTNRRSELMITMFNS